VLIYKILLPREWAEFDALGEFAGSAFDAESGFVHCSGREQVAGVAGRLFADEPALVVVALDAEGLGDRVRWEESPDGGVFPHVYAPLPKEAVVEVHHVAGAAGAWRAVGAAQT